MTTPAELLQRNRDWAERVSRDDPQFFQRVQAALTGTRVGLADNWLRHIGDVAQKHAAVLAEAGDQARRHARLCELNVIEQVVNVCQTTVAQDAWARGQPLAVHGWIYGIGDGRVRELGLGVDSPDALQPAYQAALGQLSG